MSKLQNKNKNGSQIKKHGSKIQKNKTPNSQANRAGGGKTSHSALPVTSADAEKKEDPAAKEQVVAEGNKPEGKPSEKAVIEKKEVRTTSKEKMKIGGSKEKQIVQLVPYPKPEAKLDKNKQHSKEGSKEHSQQRKLSKEKVSKLSSKEKMRQLKSKEKVEGRMGSKDKMKLSEVKEKAKDTGTKEIGTTEKRTTDVSKEISQEKKLTKEEIEMKNGKPKAKGGKMESPPIPHPKKTFLLKEGQMLLDKFKVTHALSLVHAIGFLHRDLKPSNCCVGVDDVTRIYLLDYGLTRQYLDSTGQIRKPRESIGMRGTLRYVSLEAHNRHDLGPSHDLVALLYSIIELGDGSLPWSKMRDESTIKASKQETTAEKLCEKQPKMLKVAEYVLSMKYETMPDYDKLTKMLESCHPPEVNLTDPYDWQKIACQLDHLVKRDRSGEKPPESKPPGSKNHQVMISLISDLEKPKQKTPARTPNAKTPRQF
ncbi:Protein kinase domain-containing protein [Trichostrongylus colubriformis]|uniref:non-specific serine/threonine protein kinase n=1 Tax=Trichostrongylus colubriformis TaxID=6319 RepID=A0AAN8IKN3_TRICO